MKKVKSLLNAKKKKKLAKDEKLKELQKYYTNLYRKYLKKIKMRYELVTPSLAEKYNQKNTDNYRPKLEKILYRIIQDVLNLSWTITGETIVFDVKGRVVDGQHRIDTVLKTGISLPCIIVEGVPVEAKIATGQTVPRSLWHIFYNCGERHARLLQQVINLARKIDKKVEWKHGDKFTHHQGLRYLKQNPDLRRAVDRYHKVSFESPVSTTVAAFCYYELSKIDEEETAIFIDQIFYGNSLLKKNHPISILRNFIWETKQRGGNVRGRNCVALIFRTWNAVRNNEKFTNNMLLKSISDVPDPV